MIPYARIATLLPSLGRDNDHEVIATARAIVHALGSSGHDLHDLADLVRREGAAETASAPMRSSASWAPGHRAKQARSDRDRATWLAMYGAGSLTEWEMSFVDSLLQQLGRLGSTTSPKQSARLAQIFSRVSSRTAA